MAKCEKILIAGFSGAGKSSFLKAIIAQSPDLDWSFNDLDQLVLKSHHYRSIAELVEKEGWEKFRLWERQVLESWLKDEAKGVMALGGGSLSPILLDLYGKSKKIRFCYLHAPFEECWRRLHLNQDEERPLLKKGKEHLQQVYFEREKLFTKISWQIDNSYHEDLTKLADQFWSQVLLT